MSRTSDYTIVASDTLNKVHTVGVFESRTERMRNSGGRKRISRVFISLPIRSRFKNFSTLRVKIMLMMLFCIIPFQANSQFIQNSSRSLFSDVRAFKPGDAITVLIIEDTKADNSANTTSSRSSSVDAGIDVSAGSSGFEGNAALKSGTGHQGRGNTNRSETIRSRLSVKVMELVDNGNLRIEGTRTTKVNGETQTIILKGIVRPVDIRTDNSIYSYSILDLSLSIEGDGTVSEIQEPGLLTKFLRILF